MNIKWLLQDVSMRLSQITRKFQALDKMGEPVSAIGVVKNCPYISGLSEALEDDLETRYVFLSGVKVLRAVSRATCIEELIEHPTPFQRANGACLLKRLKAGLFYDVQKFDQRHYSALDLPLLNNGAQYLPLREHLKTSFPVDKFIKPSRDLKAFDAFVLPANQSIESHLSQCSRQRFYLDETLVVAESLPMKDEYRFFVVDGQVTSGSTYRKDGIAGELGEVPENVWHQAQHYAEQYQPALVFTLDLARLSDGRILIIEYNCFNCSGVYLCEMVNTFSAIKTLLSQQNK